MSGQKLIKASPPDLAPMSLHRLTRLISVDKDAQLVILPPVRREDIPKLCEQLIDLLDGDRRPFVECDVGAVDQPDLVIVDALARLQLIALRHNSFLRIEAACPKLILLLSLTGLGGVILHGQAKQRENTIDVEEVVHPGDAAI